MDTSVWVLHLRAGNRKMTDLLNDGRIACHPFVMDEPACGNLKNRRAILSLLSSLPMTVVAKHDEILTFIESHQLMGKELSYVDVHLLSSARLTGIPLWTLDKKLGQAAESFQTRFH